MVGIYKITSKINSKMYIGESENILKRWSTHLRYLYANKHENYKLQEDFNKYGITNFTFEVLEIIEDKKFKEQYLTLELLKLEYKYIEKFNATINGYNIEEDSTDKVIKLKSNKRREILKEKNKYSDKEIEEIIKTQNEKINNKLEMIENKINIPIKVNKKQSKKPKYTSSKEYLIDHPDSLLKNNDKYIRNSQYFLYELIDENYNVDLIKSTKLFKILRENNIFYYDEENFNVPYKEFIDKDYFILKERTFEKEDKVTKYNQIYITDEGKQFLTDFLLQNNYMTINN